MSLDSFGAKRELNVGEKSYIYFDIGACGDIVNKLPKSLKVLLENLLRYEDGKTVTKNDIENLLGWLKEGKSTHEIAYRPARVLMQDFTGVPAIVDLAAMRDAMVKLGGDATKINPMVPIDLVIDHSVQVDRFGSVDSYKINVEHEMRRNKERYEFLRWGQEAFDNFRVVPPGTGICHQVNLEYLAKVVWINEVNGKSVIYPDSLVGTDSHTTMINGISVLGWGVGGIEAEAAMLGQPISMLIPEVVGVNLRGSLPEGATATDLVLTVTERLRQKGVVGKFVEFYGDGVAGLSLADRATISNMAPEYGATCGFFPVDEQTMNYLELSGRAEENIKLVEAYAKAQGMWGSSDAKFTDSIDVDLSVIESSLAGPKRPQDRVTLSSIAASYRKACEETGGKSLGKEVSVSGKEYNLKDGAVVIGAITSCTNTSNPSVMIAAGLVAKKAKELGLSVKPWVKTSLAPGSKVVTEYLEKAGLQGYLNDLGFNLVGYGCTTCIGNSGPLDSDIENAISENDLTVGSVLSGNRNFEGRVHPLCKVNYLASPPLVVAYSLAGTVDIDLAKDPINKDSQGNDVYLRDIWPSNSEINDLMHAVVKRDMFIKKYKDVFLGDEDWQNISVSKGSNYSWDDSNTYIQNPPYFENLKAGSEKETFECDGANILALLGDSITTDHISPAGNIAKNTPAARYLNSLGIEVKDFNSYGSRRGNHNVMMRGTFANIRIKNEMAGKEGGYTKYVPSGEEVSIYDAAMKYKVGNVPLVVIGGKEYGTGSSRDWAAKGTKLLGVKAVVAESFERIHRSNLVGMGVLPLVFKDNVSRKSLGLDGSERITIEKFDSNVRPKFDIGCSIEKEDGSIVNITLLCRLDTEAEIRYFFDGGILNSVIKNLIA